MTGLTRRRVLIALGAVGAAAAVGAGGVALQWIDRPPGEGLRVLSDDEHAFVDALAEAWLPPGGTPPLSGAEARLGDFFDELLSHMLPGQRTELKALLQVLDDLPRATRLAPFRALPLGDRVAILSGWLNSDVWVLRNAAQAVLALIGGGYATHPEVVPTLQPWFGCRHGR